MSIVELLAAANNGGIIMSAGEACAVIESMHTPVALFNFDRELIAYCDEKRDFYALSYLLNKMNNEKEYEVIMNSDGLHVREA